MAVTGLEGEVLIKVLIVAAIFMKKFVLRSAVNSFITKSSLDIVDIIKTTVTKCCACFIRQ